MTKNAQKKPQNPAADKPMDLSNAQTWAKLHNQIIGGAGDKANAYAERKLIVEEDLPLRKHYILFAVVGSVTLFLLWASFAKLDESTRGDGKVIPSQEIQVIQHQEGGIVDAFLVKEGDIVKKDQILIRLREVGAASELGASEARYLGLKAKVARLQAETEGKAIPNFPKDVMEKAPQSVQEELNALRANQLNLSSQISVLESQLSQRQQEVSEASRRSADLQRVANLSQEQIDMLAPLVERGSAPKRDMLSQKQQLAQQQTDLNAARSSIPRLNSAIAEVRNRINDVRNEYGARAQNDLAQTMLEMQSIEKSLGALEDRKTRTDIRSPVDGVVKDLRINTVGGVIKPGDTVVEVVPTDDTLLIEARVRPADIAFIRPRQEAMVKFTAYDSSIYGGLKGQVDDISADTIVDEKGNAFYRVRIRTKQTEIVHSGQHLPIIPGMVAQVSILTGHKTVMQYILKPFIKTIDSALHER